MFLLYHTHFLFPSSFSAFLTSAQKIAAGGEAELQFVQPITSPFKFARSPRTDPPGTFRNGSGGASTGWFVDTYREQGIEFDAIYGWEATPMNATAYYEEVPEELLAKLFWSRRAAG